MEASGAKYTLEVLVEVFDEETGKSKIDTKTLVFAELDTPYRVVRHFKGRITPLYAAFDGKLYKDFLDE